MILTLATLLALGAALALAFGVVLRRRRRATVPVAGDTFDELSESERCDFVFAIAPLDDSRSNALLERALGDPSEIVATAAARAMTQHGRKERLAEYLELHPGKRSSRIADTMELLG
ncbi:MAG: hypothetical protein JO263_08935 [Candidatus Eremiobacteraeota bacterium]|nr:hypothetical protein [Candidatus Eremiobacteraeota bacterium]